MHYGITFPSYTHCRPERHQPRISFRCARQDASLDEHLLSNDGGWDILEDCRRRSFQRCRLPVTVFRSHFFRITTLSRKRGKAKRVGGLLLEV